MAKLIKYFILLFLLAPFGFASLKAGDSSLLDNKEYFDGICFEITVESKYPDAIDQNIIGKIQNIIENEIVFHKGRLTHMPDISLKVSISKFKQKKSGKYYLYLDADYTITNMTDNRVEVLDRLSVSGIASRREHAEKKMLTEFLRTLFDNDQYRLLARDISKTSDDKNAFILENLAGKVCNELNKQRVGNINIGILAFINDNQHYYTTIFSNQIYHLIDRQKYKVIERNQLGKILAEQRLQLSGVVSDKEIVKIGEISSVHYLLIGALKQLGRNKYLQVKIVNTKSGEIMVSEMAALKN